MYLIWGHTAVVSSGISRSLFFIKVALSEKGLVRLDQESQCLSVSLPFHSFCVSFLISNTLLLEVRAVTPWRKRPRPKSHGGGSLYDLSLPDRSQLTFSAKGMVFPCSLVLDTSPAMPAFEYVASHSTFQRPKNFLSLIG